MGLFGPSKLRMVSPDLALPGRGQAMLVPERHRVLGVPLRPPFPQGYGVALFGMGCFWGAERRFWPLPGVYCTAVGYGGGFTPNPTYDEVCSGRTGHAELVQVVWDPGQRDFHDLLVLFWESHDPTQGMRQGNDVGTQYRSCLFVADPFLLALAQDSAAHYQARLAARGAGEITTQLAGAEIFYYAEPYHQQYLDANPGGYCGLRGSGIPFA